jgi:hypothetical protein
LHAGDFGNLFGNSDVWRGSMLREVHSQLHDSGINTDRRVTFLLAETDRGLSFITLVDDPTQSGTGDRLMSEVTMESFASDESIGSITDRRGDIQTEFDPPSNGQIADGAFCWNADKKGEGFAWTNLALDQFMSFSFDRNGPHYRTHPGLRRPKTFQFASWNGERWEIVARRKFIDGAFDFSFTVIPLPPAAWLGLAGLGMVAGVRARRRRAMKSSEAASDTLS